MPASKSIDSKKRKWTGIKNTSWWVVVKLNETREVQKESQQNKSKYESLAGIDRIVSDQQREWNNMEVPTGAQPERRPSPIQERLRVQEWKSIETTLEILPSWSYNR